MADFPIIHAVVTSSPWQRDEKTLRVWIALLGLAHHSVIQATYKTVAYSAWVTEEECRAAVKILCEPDPEDPAESTRLVEKIDGGFRIIAERFLDHIVTPPPNETRRHYMRDYMRDYRKGKRKTALRRNREQASEPFPDPNDEAAAKDASVNPAEGQEI